MQSTVPLSSEGGSAAEEATAESEAKGDGGEVSEVEEATGGVEVRGPEAASEVAGAAWPTSGDCCWTTGGTGNTRVAQMSFWSATDTHLRRQKGPMWPSRPQRKHRRVWLSVKTSNTSSNKPALSVTAMKSGKMAPPASETASCTWTTPFDAFGSRDLGSRWR